MEKNRGAFLKYSASSVVCFLLDYGLFTLLNAVLLRDMADGARELIATYGARIVSAVVNFLLNRNLVFRDASDPRRDTLCWPSPRRPSPPCWFTRCAASPAPAP